MRTKILSLLLILFAINNVTFGQGKLLSDEQSDLFYLSTKFCIDNISSTSKTHLSDIIERNNLPINDDLYCFNENEKKVTVGMLATSEKKDFILPSFFSNNYTWVFVWSDFEKVCKKKGIKIDLYPNALDRKIMIADVSPIRLAHLLGIRNSPQILWLCTFTVKVEDLFRPAYETSVYKNINKSRIYGFNISENLSEHDIEWLKTLLYNNVYPWTRLGYTFDCAYVYSTLYKSKSAPKDLKDAIGVSEFILKPRSRIEDVKAYIINP